MFKILCGHIFSFFLGILLGAKVLYHVVTLFNILEDSFPK